MSRPDPRDPEAEARYRAAYQRAKELSASLAGPSLAEQLVALGVEDPAALEALLASMPALDLARLAYSWEFYARPKQRPGLLPRHRILLWCAARGLGKSRAAAERVRERIYAGSRSGVLAAPTIEDVERYILGGSESEASRANGAHGVVPSANRVGLLDVFPPSQRPVYHRAKGELHFHTGAVYVIATAQSPELRGPNPDTVWLEEATSPKISRTKRRTLWDNIRLSARRQGVIPVEILVTCTPTPDPWLRELVADPACVTILGATEENAGNLDEGYLADLRAKFGGSRKGRQETEGEILDDGEGALFSAVIFDETRWKKLPVLKRIVVAVDPAISTKRRNDNTAIVAAGRGEDDELYLLAAKSGKWSPEEWATEALKMKEATGAECIVGERNRGGDLVASTVRLVAAQRARERGTVSAVKVAEVHATKSKPVRLEEVQTLHEQGRLHSHPDGLPAIEDDATTWDPSSGGASPNGPDAMAWAAFWLFDGWGEGTEEQEKRKREEQAAASRAAFVGFAEAQAKMPAPAFGALRETAAAEADAADWDRV